MVTLSIAERLVAVEARAEGDQADAASLALPAMDDVPLSCWLECGPCSKTDLLVALQDQEALQERNHDPPRSITAQDHQTPTTINSHGPWHNHADSPTRLSLEGFRQCSPYGRCSL